MSENVCKERLSELVHWDETHCESAGDWSYRLYKARPTSVAIHGWNAAGPVFSCSKGCSRQHNSFIAVDDWLLTSEIVPSIN